VIYATAHCTLQKLLNHGIINLKQLGCGLPVRVYLSGCRLGIENKGNATMGNNNKLGVMLVIRLALIIGLLLLVFHLVDGYVIPYVRLQTYRNCSQIGQFLEESFVSSCASIVSTVLENNIISHYMPLLGMGCNVLGILLISIASLMTRRTTTKTKSGATIFYGLANGLLFLACMIDITLVFLIPVSFRLLGSSFPNYSDVQQSFTNSVFALCVLAIIMIPLYVCMYKQYQNIKSFSAITIDKEKIKDTVWFAVLTLALFFVIHSIISIPNTIAF